MSTSLKKHTREGSVRNVVSFGLLRTLSWVVATAWVAACGGSSGGGNSKEYSGVYLPQGDGIYDRFEFQPGHKVGVTFGPVARTVDYAVMPDGRIQIFGDKVQTLREMDDGCLVLRGTGGDGVEIDLVDFGRYCRQ
jgi:hypothetical protein